MYIELASQEGISKVCREGLPSLALCCFLDPSERATRMVPC